MFKLNKFLISTFTVFALLSSSIMASTFHYEYKVKYHVTIRNITAGIVEGPFVFETHTGKFHLFTLGKPATAGLKEQARSGKTDLLKQELAASEKVCDVIMTDGLLEPGKAKTIEIETSSKCHFFSTSANFSPSNDGFVAINKKPLPYWKKTYFGRAYDAGAEFNSGSCVDKPGPQCNGTGSDDVDFKTDPLDFVRAFAPYTVEIAERAATIDLTDDAAVLAAAQEGIILGRAQFANPVIKVSIKAVYD